LATAIAQSIRQILMYEYNEDSDVVVEWLHLRFHSLHGKFNSDSNVFCFHVKW
jgi:hypothetical protein